MGNLARSCENSVTLLLVTISISPGLKRRCYELVYKYLPLHALTNDQLQMFPPILSYSLIKLFSRFS